MWYCNICDYYNPPLSETCISCHVINDKKNRINDTINDPIKDPINDSEWEILNELL